MLKYKDMSHPVRVRGLKLDTGDVSLILKKSHPVRVRGLKRSCPPAWIGQLKSHPVRVRGLKLLSRYGPRQHLVVAPRAGAWIETRVAVEYLQSQLVAPRAGAWIETSR